jgi:hypothetical protein
MSEQFDGMGENRARQMRINRVLRLWILIIGSCVTVAMIYGSGMRSQKKMAQAIDERRKVALQDAREARREGQLRLAVIQQLMARERVAQAYKEITDDFGNEHDVDKAGEAIAEAVKLLQQAEESNAVIADLTRSRLLLEKAATDPSLINRDYLTEVQNQMDNKLVVFTEEFVRNAEAYDKAHVIKPPTLNDYPRLPGREFGR